MNGFKITAVLSILGEIRYEQFEIKEKIDQFDIKKHKWIELEDKID